MTHITLTAAEVRACMDGRKTQHRVALRNPEYFGCPTGDCPHNYQAECNAAMAALSGDDIGYSPGDLIWVRETFGFNHWEFEREPCPKERPATLGAGYISYKATEDDSEIYQNLRYRPRQNMPRWASRMTWRVTAVRVERLQDISEADAIASGFTTYANSVTIDCDTPSPLDDFKRQWTTRHTAASWDANPWVCALEFETIMQNIEEVK